MEVELGELASLSFCSKRTRAENSEANEGGVDAKNFRKPTVKKDYPVVGVEYAKAKRHFPYCN